MKALQKTFELMMKHRSDQANVASPGYQAKQSPDAEALPDLGQLGTLELLYQLFKEDGDEMVGNPGSVFAAFNREQGKLIVFTENSEDVGFFQHRTYGILTALDWAQENNAAFLVDGTQVCCVMGGLSAKGSSYGEAALRILVMHQRLQHCSDKGRPSR